MKPVFVDGHQVALISENDNGFLEKIITDDLKRLKEEEEVNKKIKSGELPKRQPTQYWDISDKD